MTRPVFILGLSAALAALIGATWYMRPMYEVGPIGIRGRTPPAECHAFAPGTRSSVPASFHVARFRPTR